MGLGIPELIVILFIIILIFGASRLPEIGRGLGRGIRNFKDATKTACTRTSSEDEAARRGPPRHPLAIEVFEQGNRILARHAVAILEGRDIHGCRARLPQRPHVPLQVFQRLDMKVQSVEADEPLLLAVLAAPRAATSAPTPDCAVAVRTSGGARPASRKPARSPPSPRRPPRSLSPGDRSRSVCP